MSGAFKNHKKCLYILHFEGRFKYEKSPFEENINRLVLGYQVHPRATAWLGYDFISIDRDPVHYRQAVWQQALFELVRNEKIMFTFRTRLEERTRFDVKGLAWRLREELRIKIDQGISERISPLFYNECFFNLNKTAWVPIKGFSQNWLFAGVVVSAPDDQFWEIGYLNRILITNQNKHDMQHVFSIAFRMLR